MPPDSSRMMSPKRMADLITYSWNCTSTSMNPRPAITSLIRCRITEVQQDIATSKWLGISAYMSLANTAIEDDWHKRHFCQLYTPPILCKLFLDVLVQPRLSYSVPANWSKKARLYQRLWLQELYLPKQCLNPCMRQSPGTPMCACESLV